ncbi:MAG TPA: hypothetical protein VIE41_10680 [Methylomirabilota bacterium]|jgi:hypothetical protein
MMSRRSCISVAAFAGIQTAYPSVRACSKALDAREKEAKKATYVTGNASPIPWIRAPRS